MARTGRPSRRTASKAGHILADPYADPAWKSLVSTALNDAPRRPRRRRRRKRRHAAEPFEDSD